MPQPCFDLGKRILLPLEPNLLDEDILAAERHSNVAATKQRRSGMISSIHPSSEVGGTHAAVKFAPQR